MSVTGGCRCVQARPLRHNVTTMGNLRAPGPFVLRTIRRRALHHRVVCREGYQGIGKAEREGGRRTKVGQTGGAWASTYNVLGLWWASSKSRLKPQVQMQSAAGRSARRREPVEQSSRALRSERGRDLCTEEREERILRAGVVLPRRNKTNSTRGIRNPKKRKSKRGLQNGRKQRGAGKQILRG